MPERASISVAQARCEPWTRLPACEDRACYPLRVEIDCWIARADPMRTVQTRDLVLLSKTHFGQDSILAAILRSVTPIRVVIHTAASEAEALRRATALRVSLRPVETEVRLVRDPQWQWFDSWFSGRI